jgi:gas vesicle protein
MYDKIDQKLKDTYLKLNNSIQINTSLQQELRTKNYTIDTLQKQKQQIEERLKEVKEENVRF